ncbi:tRNA (adenosine(37)-N6)-threonylcarbamoyltransferase complex dimerization subunit type 1 TsaB [Candidatus Neomarinimicrobiota bacterium]
MKLLALETAYDICGAALFEDGNLASLEELKTPRQHNIFLADLVARCLDSGNCGFGDLDALAVSNGPGSYTGLRIGNSYSKGVAFGAKLPIIPVPTLLAMALSAEDVEMAWLATWSHGDNLYVIGLADGIPGEVKVMTWGEFFEKASGDKIGAYQLERFEGVNELDIVELCPSASNVGKFTILNGLVPTEDISSLLPYYFQNIQINIKKNANT